MKMNGNNNFKYSGNDGKIYHAIYDFDKEKLHTCNIIIISLIIVIFILIFGYLIAYLLIK
jgi:hypothetical protein